MSDSDMGVEYFELEADLDKQTVAALRLEIARLVRAYGGAIEEFRVEAGREE